VNLATTCDDGSPQLVMNDFNAPQYSVDHVLVRHHTRVPAYSCDRRHQQPAALRSDMFNNFAVTAQLEW
jgi:hypothetical protein